uniref:NADH dehydrogenase subunit 6 n=1 Tax=Phytomastax pentaspinula TaxID=3034359 RepID=UPI0024115835|nr:NADH dehydrogenase subunit 6 [Phytomastax pentaspinula]WEL32813.1 NADH dehydrogenase subunit 6 [Phytomastax pentaspinula]
MLATTSMAFLMNMMFIMTSHPMTMVITILMQTLMICTISGMIMESFWLSYLLFLIMLGGMMVLFMYITSIASNEMLKFNMNIITIMLVSITIMISINIDKYMVFYDSNNSEMCSFNQMINIKETSELMKKLYNQPTYIMSMMMMVYLLFTMIVVIKIINIKQGPVRKTTYE